MTEVDGHQLLGSQPGLDGLLVVTRHRSNDRQLGGEVEVLGIFLGQRLTMRLGGIVVHLHQLRLPQELCNLSPGHIVHMAPRAIEEVLESAR